jgi:hypothetical protein
VADELMPVAKAFPMLIEVIKNNSTLSATFKRTIIAYAGKACEEARDIGRAEGARARFDVVESWKAVNRAEAPS